MDENVCVLSGYQCQIVKVIVAYYITTEESTLNIIYCALGKKILVHNLYKSFLLEFIGNYIQGSKPKVV